MDKSLKRLTRIYDNVKVFIASAFHSFPNVVLSFGTRQGDGCRISQYLSCADSLKPSLLSRRIASASKERIEQRRYNMFLQSPRLQIPRVIMCCSPNCFADQAATLWLA